MSSPAAGRRAMVAAAHPLAAAAGLEVLRSGGAAADAAVAVNAALAVTQPPYCGLGGDFLCLHYEAATGEVTCVDGAGRAGERADLHELRRRGWLEVPRVGPASVSVPGCASGWGLLLERFGTRPLGELLAPAIRLAREGFPITAGICRVIAETAAWNTDAEWRRLFLPSGAAPLAGQPFRMPELADTLEALARGGTASFYGGDVGRAVAASLEDEGFLTSEDLRRHEAAWTVPARGGYRGLEVFQTPLPTPGPAVLLTLEILQGFDLSGLEPQSAQALHLLIEAAKLSYMDHKRCRLDRPTAERARELRARIGHTASAPAAADVDGDTTGFVVVDERGNMVSAIQSIFSAFGSGVAVAGTGLVLHNRGSYFTTDPAHPNCLAPRKRPQHTLISMLALEDGRPRLGFATMGANGQAQQIHSQFLVNLLDFGFDVQRAIERPRFIVGPPRREPDLVWVESRISPSALEGLERRGHRLERVGDYFSLMGHAHAVVADGLGGWLGGADPRGDGVALGY